SPLGSRTDRAPTACTGRVPSGFLNAMARSRDSRRLSRALRPTVNGCATWRVDHGKPNCPPVHPVLPVVRGALFFSRGYGNLRPGPPTASTSLGCFTLLVESNKRNSHLKSTSCCCNLCWNSPHSSGLVSQRLAILSWITH